MTGYDPIGTIKAICREVRDGLNSIDPTRKFTVRSVDTNWEEFVEKTGWSRSGGVIGGIVWVRVRESGEKFVSGPAHGVDVTTTYLVRCAIPCIEQRARGGADGDEQFLNDFVSRCYQKIVEIGVTNQAWLDDVGNQLTWDCNVQSGGMFTSKKEENPLFIFDTYYVTSNTLKYAPVSVAG